MISPIFDQAHTTDTCPCIRVVYNSTTGVIQNMQEKLERSYATPVASIEDAEDYIFSLATSITVPSNNVAVLAVGIMRCSNTIAARTRQRGGDTIFIHPVLLQQMLASPFASPNNDPPEPTTTVGRWTREGTFNGLTVYTSPHMWKTDVYVMALGSGGGDRIAALFEHMGQLSVDTIRPLTTSLGNVGDYIVKIKGPELVHLWLSPKK